AFSQLVFPLGTGRPSPESSKSPVPQNDQEKGGSEVKASRDAIVKTRPCSRSLRVRTLAAFPPSQFVPGTSRFAPALKFRCTTDYLTFPGFRVFRRARAPPFS